MNKIVLMAGKGSRFTDIGYPAPKPFIDVNGKYILQHTTESAGSLVDHETKYNKDLYFAFRQEDEDFFNVTARLKRVYGEKIDTVIFDSLTRGNLETALITVNKLQLDDNSPVLFLDSDNKYNGENLESFLEVLHQFDKNDFASIVYFDPIDNSSKWCFAFVDSQTKKITQLKEKDENAVYEGGKPMVGVFYFSSVKLFKALAEKVMNERDTVHNEFFMSQSIVEAIDSNINVYGLKVDEVVPLGTPKDVVKGRNLL